MHSKIQLVRRWLAAAVMAVAAVGMSASTSLSLTSDYEENAKENLLQTLTLQMQTYRWELDEAVRVLPPEDRRYAAAYDLVQRAEQLIHRMRAAHPMEVITVRGEYERVRSELDRALGRDRTAW